MKSLGDTGGIQSGALFRSVGVVAVEVGIHFAQPFVQSDGLEFVARDAVQIDEVSTCLFVGLACLAPE